MRIVEKPKNRGKIRQIIGREYFILKRKLDWYFGSERYADRTANEKFENVVFEHKSVILRKLKDVDMYLQENKRTNLKLAIKHIDKIVIQPGETFSVWKLVGRPNKRKGYLEGLVLNNGKIDKGIGGGLCQLGNLLFWIFIHSPLTIKERYRHGFDVFPDVNRKVPFGAGATLAYNYIDLQVKNETDNTFIIELWTDKTHLNGRLTSKFEVKEKYEIVERNHQVKTQFWGGNTRHNQIYQLITRENGEQVEKLVVENHAIMMYNPFLNEKSLNNQ